MSKDRRIPDDPALQEESVNVDAVSDEELLRTQTMLRILFRNAYYKYHADELIPDSPPDFSFMDEAPAEGTKQEIPEKKGTARRRNSWRTRRIAAALLLCFLVGGGMICMTDTPVAHAARFHLEKIMYQVSGNYYTSDDSPEDREDSITIRVDSMEEIDRAVRFMPELYVPSAVPGGWELDRLELSKTIKGIKTAKYTFYNQASESFTIDETLPSEDQPAGSGVQGDSVQLDHRKVLLFRDENTGLSEAGFTENGVLVRLAGDLAEEDLLRVADSMTQSGEISE